jgi:hypothetical protein
MTEIPTPQSAAVELHALAEPVNPVVAAADGLTVRDEDDVAIAAEMLAQLKQPIDAIEARRQELSLPLTRVARQINEAAKTEAAPLVKASTILRQKIKEYREERRRLEREALEAAQADSGQKVVDPGLLPAPVATTVKTASGAAVGGRLYWTHEVTDLHALVKAAAANWEEYGQYLAAAPTYIGQAVKNGVREIPGVRIYETESVVVR